MGQNLKEMSTPKKKPLKKVALVSVPWPLYSRPSIQLGTLKSYLESQFSDLKVDTHHAYLKVAAQIGYPLYGAISERTWLAETVYGALLYPQRLEGIKKLFQRQAAGLSRLREVDFKKLTAKVEAASKDFIRSVEWATYGLAGFSICLCQLTSSLYFIRKIKRKYPNLIIVVGGSMFAGESIRSIFEVFPEINFVVNGEGEIPISRLVQHLIDTKKTADVPSIAGVVTPQSAKNNESIGFDQLEDLTALPSPDYRDYFNLLNTLGPQNAFFPTLPLELSRGCWWQKNTKNSRQAGCAFCNLNLQWDGYRSKTPSKAAAEINDLTKKHKTLSVAFMDNLLPLKNYGSIFRQLEGQGKDLRLFGEIRASTPKRVLASMQAAGIQEVQIGIEALSTRLLNRLNKGTTAIQNLEIMKHCQALGVVNSSNLIIYFPGSDQQEVDETLRCLDFAVYFHPLKTVRFWLGYGSPVWQNPKTYGLKAVFNHPNYAAIFPGDICNAVQFPIQGYRADLGHQKKMWQPVKEKLKQWKKIYAELNKGAFCGHILSYWDGRDFLIIRQKRYGDEPLTHRLEKTSRAIYLFCEHRRSIKTIVSRFQGMPEEKIEPFLKMMVSKKLMFEENETYLSLAVPARH